MFLFFLICFYNPIFGSHYIALLDPVALYGFIYSFVLLDFIWYYLLIVIVVGISLRWIDIHVLLAGFHLPALSQLPGGRLVELVAFYFHFIFFFEVLLSSSGCTHGTYQLSVYFTASHLWGASRLGISYQL